MSDNDPVNTGFHAHDMVVSAGAYLESMVSTFSHHACFTKTPVTPHRAPPPRPFPYNADGLFCVQGEIQWPYREIGQESYRVIGEWYDLTQPIRQCDCSSSNEQTGSLDTVAIGKWFDHNIIEIITETDALLVEYYELKQLIGFEFTEMFLLLERNDTLFYRSAMRCLHGFNNMYHVKRTFESSSNYNIRLANDEMAKIAVGGGVPLFEWRPPKADYTEYPL